MHEMSHSRAAFVIFPATPRFHLPPFTPFPMLAMGGNRK